MIKRLWRKRRISTLYNLEKDPGTVGVPKVMTPDQFSSGGLPPAEPIFSAERGLSKSFAGWPLMLWFAVIVLAIGAVIGSLTSQMLREYIARLVG